MLVELTPGGLISVGTSYSDPRILWMGGVRLAFGILALFTIIKAISGYFGYVTHDGSEDLKEAAFQTLRDSALFLVIALIGAAVAPYAVTAVFNWMGGSGGTINFG